jgi:hypothetical protein
VLYIERSEKNVYNHSTSGFDANAQEKKM